MICGAAAFAIPLAVMGTRNGASWLGGVPILSGLAMVLASSAVLLLGVLPTEVASIKAANRFLCTAAALFGFLVAVVVMVLVKRGLEGDYWRWERAKWGATLC